jgi:flagellar basal-body rod modification protein FlgD
MEVSNSNAVNQNYKVEETKNRMSLSTEDFLKIMAAELKYQSPTGESSSSTDFMSQLSQYTMLDKITELTENIIQMNMLNQVSLIGKEVSVWGGEEVITGIVERVKFQNQNVLLQVNGQDYEAKMLLNVSNQTANEFSNEYSAEEEGIDEL